MCNWKSPTIPRARKITVRLKKDNQVIHMKKLDIGINWQDFKTVVIKILKNL